MESKKNFELQEGENCWRRSHIEDGSFILSGREYFRAFRQALLQAERYVYILAWDLSESIDLVRDDDFDDGHPPNMGDFVFSVLDSKPDLEIYILLWDYSLVYAAEREWLPFTAWREREQPRLHLKADDAINVGASHHQKVVVIDDSLAFCGGFDLSAWRWDTKEHLAHDPRRKNPDDELYQPYHDIQIALTGQAAKDLGDLCNDRWRRATGENLPRRKATDKGSLLPECITRDFRNMEVGIALTYSSYKEYQAVYQIEKLYLEIIKSSRKYIYIENQYLSSHLITDSLIERLQQPEGPEIIIVLTQETGWIEESTLGLLRDRLLEKLVEADTYGRFFALYPYVEDDNGHETQVYVHAKLLIADDRIAVFGSANLTNRSMKVDSEVDLILKHEKPVEEIKRLLHRLFAIHFNCSEQTVIRSFKKESSLCDVIQALGTNCPHRLRKLETGTESQLLRKLAGTQLLDPGEPISPAHWIREGIKGSEEKGGQEGGEGSYVKWGIVLFAGVFLAWLLNSLWGSVLDKDTVLNFLEGFRSSPALLPILFCIFFVAGLIAAPINVLLVASTVAIGPWVTFGCGLAGALFSAVAAFFAGSWFGKPLIKKVAKKHLEKLSSKVAERGILSVALIRLVPIAPFVVVNLVAGFSNISFAVFLFGSILGMVPGMLGVVVMTHVAQSAFIEPQWQTWLILCIGLTVLVTVGYILRKKFR
ncbi:MAG: VTT domain-containing protein [Desulforhopalus sp.]